MAKKRTEDDVPAEAPAEAPVIVYPAYTVHEDLEVAFCDRDGSEVRHSFPAGTARPESEDEWFVLEHILVPQGAAERVKKEL